jgi:hypothetical protein
MNDPETCANASVNGASSAFLYMQTSTYLTDHSVPAQEPAMDAESRLRLHSTHLVAPPVSRAEVRIWIHH